jgi:hypothetical protein
LDLTNDKELLDNNYFFMLHFKTFDVEENIESLVYDASNLLISIGGNLGLFLGFSAMSVLFSFIDVLENNWGRLKKKSVSEFS